MNDGGRYNVGMKFTATELKQKLEIGEKWQVIDVRSPGEYAAGHIPGAVNMPMEQVEARLADMRANEPVVLVCQSGQRAEMCRGLIERHREDLHVLEGGTSAWQEAGYKTVCSAATRWSIERQVRLVAGLLVLIGTVLSVFVAPAWVYLAMFIGAGLTFAGLTNVCGMALLFGAMPWNKPKKALAAEEATVAR
jgi:rhodanese-related sulfurtransferase